MPEVETIRRENVTTLHFVPSMLQAFIEHVAVEDSQTEHIPAWACLRRVICSGEALSADLQRRFFGCMQAELHNLYGPTEATIAEFVSALAKSTLTIPELKSRWMLWKRFEPGSSFGGYW